MQNHHTTDALAVLTDPLVGALQAKLTSDENVLAIVPVDLSADLQFGTGLLALTQKRLLACDPQSQTIFISHGDCLEDAQFLANEIKRRFGVREIHINMISPVIGSHSGPGTVALFFLTPTRNIETSRHKKFNR